MAAGLVTPADMASCWRGAALPGSSPYQQGQLGGLCGLYSVVNALRLAAAPRLALSTEQCERLYWRGIDVIASSADLADVLRSGMDLALRRALVDDLALLLATEAGVSMQSKRPFRARADASGPTIEATLAAAAAQGTPALLRLAGVHDHFTVVRGHTRHRWLLFDSSGLHWLAKRSCGSLRSDKRHLLDAASIQLLRLA